MDREILRVDKRISKRSDIKRLADSATSGQTDIISGQTSTRMDRRMDRPILLVDRRVDKGVLQVDK